MGDQGKHGNRDDEVREATLFLLVAINRKLNLLVENAGLGQKLEELAEELRNSTDSLQAVIDENQPKKGI